MSEGRNDPRLRLPPGHRIERDPDVWTLYSPDGSVVARFVAGVPDEEVEREAWMDHNESRG